MPDRGILSNSASRKNSGANSAAEAATAGGGKRRVRKSVSFSQQDNVHLFQERIDKKQAQGNFRRKKVSPLS